MFGGAAEWGLAGGAMIVVGGRLLELKIGAVCCERALLHPDLF